MSEIIENYLIIIGLIFIVLMGFIGVVCSVKSLFWEKTSATVRDFETVVSEDNILNISSARTWSPEIKYKYEVGNETYNGSKLTFFPMMFTNPTASDKFIKKLTETGIITIYYNPEAPQESVVLRRLTFLPLFCLFSGVYGLWTLLA